MSDNEKRAFHGAQCLSYPNCTGGCGLGCTHDVEASRPTTDNEMLKLAERIESLKPNRLAADNGAATFIYPNDVKAIVSALRTAAASAEPVADVDAAYEKHAKQIFGTGPKTIDSMTHFYAGFKAAHPAPDAEIVAALEAVTVFIVEEDEDKVCVSVCGVELTPVPKDRPSGRALLKFDAMQRAALAKAKGGSRT